MKEHEKYIHRKYRLDTAILMKECGIDETKEDITNIHLGDYLTLGKRNPALSISYCTTFE